MIVRKTWERRSKDRHAGDGFDRTRYYRDEYAGWFLFGMIPLYISRKRFVR